MSHHPGSRAVSFHNHGVARALRYLGIGRRYALRAEKIRIVNGPRIKSLVVCVVLPEAPNYVLKRFKLNPQTGAELAGLDEATRALVAEEPW